MALITLKIVNRFNLYTSRSDIAVFYREMNLLLFESAWKMSLQSNLESYLINISKGDWVKTEFGIVLFLASVVHFG